MILAGIDEAGLGPTLGPLVTASLAFRCPDDWTPESPWTELPDVFTRETPKKRASDETGPFPIPVADSKRIYHPGGSLHPLEQVIALFNVLVHGYAEPSPEISPDDAPHPCYGLPEPYSCACGPDAAASVREALSRVGAEAVHFAAHPLYEPAFNRIIEAGKNKSELILEQTGRHLSRLVEAFSPREPLLIVVDKQGGRNAYAAYLAGLFPHAWPRELEAGRETSRYLLTGLPHRVEIRFQAKADQTSFCTAGASMAAKYIREKAMERFNAWFAEKLPDVRPTAGYPSDAKRWLSETGARAAELFLEKVVRLK